MAKNWALVIGINNYDYLQPLNYAKRDAQLMQEFLSKEVGCEKIFFFSDDSPSVNGKSTRPNRTNLLRVLRQLFDQSFMQAGDNFWFFFSGHGMRHNDRDYLMPCDGDPGDIENTAIPINFVSERLRRCGSDNVVLILDACRNQGTRGDQGFGRQTQDIAHTTGIITIFSCTPNEYSYEIDVLQQGAFTCALLEGLGIRGKCATVERLNQYLNFRVSELSLQYRKVRQNPFIVAEPVTKSHLILVPRYATLADIATLKIDAYQAEVNKDFELAEQLWIRVLSAAYGQDMDAIRALQRIVRFSAKNKHLEAKNKHLEAKNKHLEAKNISVSSIRSNPTVTGLTYQQMLEEYKKKFTQVMQQEYPVIKDETRSILLRLQQNLQLETKDIIPVEDEITLQVASLYQEKLRQYEQKFLEAVKEEYPIGNGTRNNLKKIQQELGINYEDVLLIEKNSSGTQKKLKMYEKVLSEVIRQEYPFSNKTINQLKRLQKELNLTNKIVELIGEQIYFIDIKEIRTTIANPEFCNYPKLAQAITRRLRATNPIFLDSSHFDSSTIWEVLLPTIGLRLRTNKAVIFLRREENDSSFHESLAEIAFEKNAAFLIVVDIVDIRRPPMQVGPPTIWFRPESLIEMATMPENELLGWLGRFITTQIDVCSLPGLLPYQTTGAAREELFFGRDYELTRLIGGTLRGGIIVGAHRSGKTSLLYQLAKRLQQQEYQVVDVLTLGGIDSFKSFFERTLDLLKIDFFSEITPASWAEALRTYTKNNQKSPIFLLDEVDDLISLDTQSAFQLGRQMRSLQSDGYCKFFLAGHAKLRAAVEVEEGPFRNFAEEITLTGLTETASMRLIQQPMNLIGFEVTDKQAHRICKGTAGVAVLIQEFCIRLLRGLRQGNTSRIEDSEIEKIEQSPEYLSIVFEHYKYAQGWDSMTVLLVTTILKEVRKRDFLREMSNRGASLTISRLDKILDFLVRFGILEEFKPSEYRVLPSYLYYAIIARDPELILNSLLDKCELNQSQRIVYQKETKNRLDIFLNKVKNIFIN